MYSFSLSFDFDRNLFGVFFSEGLNDSRTSRIKEYQSMKNQISTHVQDLIKRINAEEQELQKKIDARIQLETEYLTPFLLFPCLYKLILHLIEKLLLQNVKKII